MNKSLTPPLLLLCLLIIFPVIINADTLCPNGQYSSNTTHQCQACPIMCATCAEPQDYSYVVCLSCAVNSNRNINSNQSSLCVCKEGYIETLPMKYYCCHKYCLTCNESSCTSCPLYTNRVVNSSSGLCQCKEGFIEAPGKIVCGCDNQSYFYLNRCFPCPLNCKTCQYKNQSIICKTCPDKSNRNSSTNDCSCQSSFTQTTPYISLFCYAINCNQQVDYCLSCKDPTNVSLGICLCKTGYFLNTSNVCQECQMDGCLDCKGQVICINCSVTNDYYLIQDVCAKVNIPNFIITYDENGYIIIQFDCNQTFPQNYNITVEIDKILEPHPGVIPSPFPIERIKHYINDSQILTVWFEWKNNTANITDQVMFLFEFDYWENASVIYNITSTRKNIRVERIYPPSLMKGLSVAPLEHALCLIAVLISLAAYVLGYKHNQITFFLQTLCLMGFSLADEEKTSIIFLNNLRYSYFQFTNENPMRKYPEIYIKKAEGNYNFLSIDDSYFRIFGWAFLFELITLIVFLIYVVMNSFIIKHYRSKSDRRALIKYFSQRKYFVRIIEYMFISLMYPLIFGAFQTFKNWNGLILVDFDIIKYLNKTFSIIVLVVNIAIPIGVWFSTLSSMGRILHLVQLISSIVASIIIVNCVYSHAIMVIVVVLAIKNIFYLYLRTKYMSQQIKIIKFIWITMGLETAAIIVTALNKYTAMIALTVITVVVQIIFITFVLGFYEYEKYREKLTVLNLERNDDLSTIQSEDGMYRVSVEKEKSLVSFVNEKQKERNEKMDSNSVIVKPSRNHSIE